MLDVFNKAKVRFETRFLMLSPCVPWRWTYIRMYSVYVCKYGRMSLDTKTKLISRNLKLRTVCFSSQYSYCYKLLVYSTYKCTLSSTVSVEIFHDARGGWTVEFKVNCFTNSKVTSLRAGPRPWTDTIPGPAAGQQRPVLVARLFFVLTRPAFCWN
jgi:hypothetical protein